MIPIPLTLKYHRDGSIEWRPECPAQDGLDEEKFQEELKIARLIHEGEGQKIWWYHNGVRVSSEIAYSSIDPWAWLTQQNAEMAN